MIFLKLWTIDHSHRIIYECKTQKNIYRGRDNLNKTMNQDQDIFLIKKINH